MPSPLLNKTQCIYSPSSDALSLRETAPDTIRADQLEQPMSTITPTQICLTREEQDAFRRLARPLEDYDPVTEADEFCFAAHLQCAKLPVRVRRASARPRRKGDIARVFLMRRLPVDPLPPTPDHAHYAVGVGLPAARVFAVAAAL